ncbi:PhzF family phenazine biosynthesis protein [Polaromonas sp. YR568]|uniref:PhzF family phenazine biosynthesis protein n=1 Tax=Polaromonas sp. YR568 TaxID=1855301 RepID=UPI00398BC2C2
MKQRPFKQVDVFTPTPYYGNPLAVVMDGSGLDDAAMQRFAKWTNLSETTFLLPPTDATADYRVRIFTPGGELPFAGHPTLGSCHSWLEAGGQPHAKDFIVQECQVGLVKIRREPGTKRLAFAAPPLKRSAPSPTVLAQVAAALGLKATHIVAAQCLDNGPLWLGLLLDNPETVLQLAPDHKALAKLGIKVGAAARYPREEAAPLIARANREARAFAASAPDFAPDLEVRGFVSPMGIDEDPVTGSLNASLAQWLIAEGHAPERYTASQGVCLGRAGQVHIERDSTGQVWVGGESVSCVDGSVSL